MINVIALLKCRVLCYSTQVCHFHVAILGLPFSGLPFSCRDSWSAIFRSAIFMSRFLGLPFSGLPFSVDPFHLLQTPYRQGPDSEIRLPYWGPESATLTQPHVDRLRSSFTRWYSVAPGKLRKCQNPLRIEFKMADDAQILNILTPISLERLKLETSNLVCASTTKGNFECMQKTRSKGA